MDYDELKPGRELDAFGITVSVSGLPSTKKANEAFRTLHPRGFWRRIYYGIRWMLRPEEYIELRHTCDYWRAKQKQEFLYRVMTEAQELVDNNRD